MAFNFDETVAGLEKEYGIPSGMYRDLLTKGERSGPTAVSPAGAIGYAQLMPGTARDMGVKDIWDPDENLRGGAKYFKTQYDTFGQWPLAAAAYNAGPGKVKKAGGVPDIPETHKYLKRMGMMADSTSATPVTGSDPAAMMANDPVRKKMMADLGAATEVATKANDQFAEDLKGSIAEQEKLKADVHHDIMEPLPLPPTLRDLPEPPDAREAMKDPTRALGQFLPALAVLGSLGTRRAATTAFRSAAAAMKAQKENDKENFQALHVQWKDDMEKALTTWNAERDRYLDVINNRKMSLEERMSELRVQAAIDGNKQLMAAASTGNVDMIYKNLQAGDQAAYRLANVLNAANRNDNQRSANEEKAKKDADDAAYKLSELKLKEAVANKQTLSQWLAGEYAAKASGANWTPDRDAMLTRAEATFQRLNLGTPSPAPAPGGPTPPPAAPGAGDKTHPLPLPANPKASDLHKGTYYKTARGVAMWDGAQFVQ